MKKIIKKTIKIMSIILLSFLTVIVFLFYFFPSWFVDFYVSYDEKSIWVKTIPIASSWKILDVSFINKDLSWSPNEKYLAYTDFVNEMIYDKEYFIKIINPRTFKVKTIFIGGYHTSYYRWLNDSTIRVYVSAGSGVRIYRDISIYLKEPFVAVEHLKPEYWTTQVWYEYDD